MNAHTLTFLPGLEASALPPKPAESEQSPCASPTPGAEPSLRKRGRESRSGRTLEPSAWTTPQSHDLKGRGDHQKEKHGTKHGCACLVQDLKSARPTLDAWQTPSKEIFYSRKQVGKDERELMLPGQLKAASGSLPLAFPASRPHGPGSSEARMMTAGSGRTLCASLVPSDPLGDFSRILLASETWASPEFYLTWKHKATRQGCLVWELAPSAPRTDGCDTGSSQEGLPTRIPLTNGQEATWPTPRSEDSESTGAHRGNPDTLTSATKAAWATPQSMSHNPEAHGQINGDGFTPQKVASRGPITSGCLARTGKFVERLILLSSWLMGVPWTSLRHWPKKAGRTGPS